MIPRYVELPHTLADLEQDLAAFGRFLAAASTANGIGGQIGSPG